MDLAHYAEIAGLFDYPSEGFFERTREICEALKDRCVSVETELNAFVALLPWDDLRAVQELHTRTFDVQAITTLDLGYVLFGDDYKRGEILANLNREHQQVANDCRGELADHLSNVLRLLPLLKDGELVQELVREIVVPALAAMIGEFDPERLGKKNESHRRHYQTLIEVFDREKTLYLHPLQAVFHLLCQDFGISGVRTDRKTNSDFLRSIEKEMAVEEQTVLQE